MFKDKYFKLQSDVTKWLKENLYSFYDLVNIIGCGYRTLRRYEETGIIQAVTSGSIQNSRYFTQEELNKASFVFDLYKSCRMPVTASAAFYDYLKSKRVKIDIQNILDRIEDYKDRAKV